MPVAARIAGGSSKPARASTREIGKGLHSPFKIHTAACQLIIIAARTNVTNPQASAVTFRKVAANAVFASTGAASRAEKNTIPASIGLKLAPALALTLKNDGIPKRSCCEQLRLVFVSLWDLLTLVESPVLRSWAPYILGHAAGTEYRALMWISSRTTWPDSDLAG